MINFKFHADNHRPMTVHAQFVEQSLYCTINSMTIKQNEIVISFRSQTKEMSVSARKPPVSAVLRSKSAENQYIFDASLVTAQQLQTTKCAR